jgi:hypothetical protein
MYIINFLTWWTMKASYIEPVCSYYIWYIKQKRELINKQKTWSRSVAELTHGTMKQDANLLATFSIN